MPLPNPSANLVGKRRKNMNKKIFVILLVISMQCGFYNTVNAVVDIKESDSNHIRIFTPYHNVKNVFLVLNDEVNIEDTETNAVSSQNIKLQRQISSDDIDLIASIVHAECKGEPFEGKVGVASVVINRLYHPYFPKSIKDVIFQKNAFSCVKNGSIDIEPDTEAYRAVEEALKGNDPTKSAIYFYNPKTASSKWMKTVPKVEAVMIGNHVFFK
jgi:N-acetylmuramoyl-L-alanine amidase